MLLVGDVHGEFELLAETAQRVTSELGPLDAILAVGDVEANRDGVDAAGVHAPAKYRKIGDFPYVVEGLLDLGAPLYFIGGNHEPWPALDQHGPGWWSDQAYFLGRHGAVEVAGLRVAYVSGIYSSRVSEQRAPRRESQRDRCHYTLQEVRQTVRLAQRLGPIDVLLTHDWPAGIAPPGGEAVGRPELRDLTERIQPRWHFCGHMHRRHRAMIRQTEVVCLASIHSGIDAFVLLESDERGERRVHPLR